ncbi:hypothetical protein [Clostridium oryzae]|uniref:N-acetyltransferase domain-containing protein n=1 Tax=Clostridium oryzae TaxID=1450648 RepID=A0A1V4IFB3_9CLOT|nr:hypothetical protein [Clostridium oryzae]OPJ58207.1 hypothetical protein CLORY_37020 [Clostridium oryzae]
MIKDMRLETQRLIIRPYIEDDLMESFQLMQDKELFKYKDMEVMVEKEKQKMLRGCGSVWKNKS